MRRRRRWTGSVLLMILAAGLAAGLGACARPPAPPAMMRGAWLASLGSLHLLSPEAERSLDRLRDEVGVDWIAVGPEVWMSDVHAPEMRFGEHEKGYREYLRRLEARGLKAFLLPRIESEQFFAPVSADGENPPWRGDLEMPDPESWERFYTGYRQMITWWAALAEEEGVDLFGIGLEYRIAVRKHPEQWRRIIREVRAVYSGPLVYSANWDDFDQVRFWDALDYVGVGAYFGIAETTDAPPVSLALHASGKRHELRSLVRRIGKPLLFTEVGYTGFADAGRHPWKWQTGLGEGSGRMIRHAHQAACWDALLGTFAPEPWFAGVFVWRYYPEGAPSAPGDYNPAGRPAEAVLRRWYRGPGR